MVTSAEQYRLRGEQWARYAAWQDHNDPAQAMDAETAFRWAGAMHDWHVARFGYSTRIPTPADYAGIRLMRERLAGLNRIR